MHRSNQKGFAALEIILALVLLIGIVVIGYAVWKTNKADKTVDQSKQTSAALQANAQPIAKDGQICVDLPSATNCKASDGTVYRLPSITPTGSHVDWAGLPSSLQTAVMQVWATNCTDKSYAPSAVYKSNKEGMVLDASKQFATINFGCDVTGANFLFVYTGGQWKNVAASQMNWSCAVLRQYKVPAAFIASPGHTAIACATSSDSPQVAVYNP